MDQFWIMTNGKMDGPYDAPSLLKHEGFCAKTSVYKTGDAFWRTAREFNYFRQHFESVRGSSAQDVPPQKTIISGDFMLPEDNFLPMRTRSRTAVPKVIYGRTKKPKQSSRVPVKGAKKIMSVVAICMTAAVIVHGSPMAWQPFRAFMGLRMQRMQTVVSKRLATYAPHWWHFADPKPVVLRERPAVLRRLKKVQFQSPAPTPSELSIVGRRHPPRALAGRARKHLRTKHK